MPTHKGAIGIEMSREARPPASSQMPSTAATETSATNTSPRKARERPTTVSSRTPTPIAEPRSRPARPYGFASLLA
ncbi:MAG TPA: hypothetical protein VFC82_04225 [Actinomycetaceae bacterium]|nr:hypothetical protein [Actinomycetaceae bacterium]